MGTPPSSVLDLVARYEREKTVLQSDAYGEADTRKEFIEPLFAALGWDVVNKRMYAEAYKDETEERIIDVEPGLRRCRCCGTDFEFLGTEDSEQLDWEVRLRRILWRRRRYRRRCQCPAKLAGRIAVCAPRPPKVIPRGLFTAMFLARLAYEKYVLGRPLHRIIAALAADGLDVAEGTLVGALQQVVPLLAPWAEAIEAHVAASGYVRADETGWRVFAGTPGKDGNRWWW